MPTPTTQDFEKLGAFYLGREYDLEGQKRLDSLVMYDSRDLVTHAVCVGMTGSGKTGLCIDLLEEAAIDGVPAIVIDPKGDLSNLLLTFPNLTADDFRPWVNADDAQRKGLTPEAFADQQASLWKKGLADWGQDGARIQRLRDAAEFAVYTPGSSAGIPLSILQSLTPPPSNVIDDEELFRDHVSAISGSIMAVLGSRCDTIRHWASVLLATVLSNAWRAGRSLDLSDLIRDIISPPFSMLGAMPIDVAAPEKSRFEFAQAINVVLASPSAASWISGDPISAANLLRSPSGKPRISVISIAHLSEPERMMVVSLVAQEVLSWSRQQTGTTSLRAILYMDEIAGYFPPHPNNPPSKGPLLMLMKQGRAFGVGVVLVTQNPVDIDYKGLSNAGTWFIGRLQTERDKARVLDGLEGAAANAKGGFNRSEVDKLLSRLGTRVFLMNNIHEDGPVVFESRWAMSYLRGPLTREQIKSLKSGTGGTTPAAVSAMPAATPFQTSKGATATSATNVAGTRPVLPPDVPQYFIPSRGAGDVHYQPMLLGCAKVYYSDAKLEIDTDTLASLLVPISDGPVSIDWEHAQETDLTDKDLERDPSQSGAFAPIPPDAAKAKSYDGWKKQFADTLFRTAKLDLLRNEQLGEVSKPGESERDFKARLDQAAREERDAAVEKLRAKYAPKATTLQDRIRRAEQAVAVQKEQSTSAKLGTALSVGTAILGAFLGRKTFTAGNVSKAATAARGMGRSVKESADVGRAEENVGALTQQLNDLNAQWQAETEELSAKSQAITAELEKVSLKPKKTNITVRTVVLAWAPHDASGEPQW